MNNIETFKETIRRLKVGELSSFKVIFKKDFIPEDGDLSKSISSGYLFYAKHSENIYRIVHQPQCLLKDHGEGYGIQAEHYNPSFDNFFHCSNSFQTAIEESLAKFLEEIENFWKIELGHRD